MKHNPPVVALIQDGDSNWFGVRFANQAALHAWEDLNPGVYIETSIPLGTIADAKSTAYK